NSDCASGVCDTTAGTCVAPACDDQVKNGDETDTDCGGSCPTQCAVGQGCAQTTDCDGGIGRSENLCRAQLTDVEDTALVQAGTTTSVPLTGGTVPANTAIDATTQTAPVNAAKAVKLFFSTNATDFTEVDMVKGTATATHDVWTAS